MVFSLLCFSLLMFQRLLNKWREKNRIMYRTCSPFRLFRSMLGRSHLHILIITMLAFEIFIRRMKKLKSRRWLPDKIKPSADTCCRWIVAEINWMNINICARLQNLLSLYSILQNKQYFLFMYSISSNEPSLCSILKGGANSVFTCWALLWMVHNGLERMLNSYICFQQWNLFVLFFF